MKAADASQIDTVVLLHGLALSPTLMWPMAARLERAGWRVHRIGYPSTQHDLPTMLAMVRQRLRSFGPVHIVGHSLGGLIGAELLRAREQPEIGRVVQLGSPNLGSPQADRAIRVAPARWYFGPVLGELREHDDAPETESRVGAIVGRIWPNIAGGQGDGVVRVESAIAGAGEHVVVRRMHTFLPFSGIVARQASVFLSTGHFEALT